MITPRLSALALLAPLALAGGCSKKSDAPTSASSASASASAAPAASASAGSGGICPPGSSGKGTGDEPCLGKNRVLVGKWTGKTKGKAVFSVTNKLKYTIDFVQASTYYYDASGKQLPVTLKSWPGHQNWNAGNSGGVFEINGGETKEVELGFDAAEIPKDAKTIEVEFNKVGWTPPGAPAELYWSNDALDPMMRPQGGVK